MRLWMLVAGGLLTLLMSPLVLAQVSVEEVDWKTYPLEPGAEIPMQPPDEDQEAAPGPAALGDGAIVFKFKLTDVDPIADDASDVEITCFRILNLGTAVAADIAQVMVLDQDGNAVAPPQMPQPAGLAVNVRPGCDRLGVVGAHVQAQFEVAFDAGDLGGPFVIPDDGMETFQIAVRVAGTDVLGDGSQNHTLMLQVEVQLDETVGSPPAPTTFASPMVMDSIPDIIWNGGINKFSDDTWTVNPLMPGETGVVARFTVCDYDANEHELVLTAFHLRQGEGGNAISSDLTGLTLYRLDGFTRSLVASRTPDSTFNRGSGLPGGLRMPAIGETAVIVPDDECRTFELEAKVSPFAFKMHAIQPRIRISAREPRISQVIDSSVEPEVAVEARTLIGKGGLVLPDTKLIGKAGIIPIQVMGVRLPGLATLQVGPRGSLQFDPHVIRVDAVRGVAPYLVGAVELDNRRGEVRFTVRIDPSHDADGDGMPDPPELTALQDGTVAQVFATPIGLPGDRTRLTLTYDCVEVVAQFNCLPTGFPFPGTPNQNPNNDISVMAGEVELLYPGDLDFDGRPSIRDALMLANAILRCDALDASLPPGLSDQQRHAADVAAPFADEDKVPTCADLTSADVAKIASLAINFGTQPAPAVRAASISMVQPSVLRLDGVRVLRQGRGGFEFRAWGAGIVALRVQMFDLSGRTLIDAEVAGGRLVTQLNREQPLANGVYLYTITARGRDGQVARSGVRKLAVLR